jgi:predicted nuclease of restriction endonuclease-like RecB superfamily
LVLNFHKKNHPSNPEIRIMDDKTTKLALKIINLNIEDLREKYEELLNRLKELEKKIDNLTSISKN